MNDNALNEYTRQNGIQYYLVKNFDRRLFF